MGVHDDIALLRLPENLGQGNDWHAARTDEIAQEIPWADRRKLVGVADQHQAGAVRQRLKQRLHKRHIDHRHLIEHDDIALQRVGPAALEGQAAAARRVAGF